ncbi:hypothetical protein [Catellatospora sichuanensis]|uniref:hypothetical protein n=1 Tax=Catellatospora sichuanensis TaxID=1969805 RepID=UPI0011832642|nr:hypothetical protein [Catellatospora sichuanensis]
MRRTAVSVLLAVVMTGVVACSDAAEPQAGPSVVPASSAASDVLASVPAACEAADGLYATLNTQTQQHIQRGFEAEKRGDKATVAKELEALEPTFLAVAAKFAEASDRVADAEVKVALTDLSDAAVAASTFTKFSEFGSMQQLTVSGELVLIRRCRNAGYKLVNLV